MIKTLFSFLLVCLFLLGFGQKPRDTVTCYRETMKWRAISDIVKQEGSEINYNSLSERIINDLDQEKIRSENLVFIYPVNNPNPFDNEPQIDKCDIDANFYAFNFDKDTFWSKRNIKLISKKLKKNLILSNQGLDFVEPANKNIKKYDDDWYNCPAFYRSVVIPNNKHYFLLKEYFRIQKLGVYNRDNEELKKIYYFPHNKKEHLDLVSDYFRNNNNFNLLQLSFINLPNRIVQVSYVYDMDYENVVTKSYQYQNKTWVEIPTKKEYEF